MRVIVVLRHKAEAVLHVERNCTQVGVRRQKTATNQVGSFVYNIQKF